MLAPWVALAQTTHSHALQVNGVPGGVPYFCADPTVVAVADGAWSSPGTWSTNSVPGRGDKVLIGAGRTIVYDVMNDARLQCIELHGRLSFRTDADTRMKVVNLLVMSDGALETGTPAKPVDAHVSAEIVIADQRVDTTVDPAQVGNGISGLGRITMHGAVKTPTFTRLAREARAGQTMLTLEQPVPSWRAGDHIVIPDTRQVRENERGSNYRSRDEKIAIASVSGAQIVLTSPLEHDHSGVRNDEGQVEFLPHVGNVSRNVRVRSENPGGTRGHMLFMYRADVDLRYVEVRDMGRTKAGVLESTSFDSAGRVVRVGTNQIGRYAIHFHHTFGPKATPANGYQFTLIGNSVDGASKWGITVHNSHYGLVQDNVVYNTRGAAIVTEDGTESFNVFDRNFAIRSEGSGDLAPRSGYGGPGPDPGGEGSGFWFHGPNNYIRNNVAANADVFGFNLAAGSPGTVRVPAFKGADTSRAGETRALAQADAQVLEFTGNEAYGAIQAGIEYGWNGVIENFRVWNAARYGVTGTPTDRLVIEGLVVRGDKSTLSDELANSTGVWIGNYASKSIVVRNVDIEGMRVGVASPFFQNSYMPEPGRGDGSLVIEHSRFRTYVGVAVATAYAAQAKRDGPLKKAIVRSSTFEPLTDVPAGSHPPAAVSMNYRMAPGDVEPREPILVYDFNGRAGDTFKVYYSLEAPSQVAPCHESRREIGGWVCR